MAGRRGRRKDRAWRPPAPPHVVGGAVARRRGDGGGAHVALGAREDEPRDDASSDRKDWASFSLITTCVTTTGDEPEAAGRLDAVDEHGREGQEAQPRDLRQPTMRACAAGRVVTVVGFGRGGARFRILPSRPLHPVNLVRVCLACVVSAGDGRNGRPVTVVLEESLRVVPFNFDDFAPAPPDPS